jgi:hypothetical protein
MDLLCRSVSIDDCRPNLRNLRRSAFRVAGTGVPSINLVKRGFDFLPISRLGGFEEAFDVVGDLDIMLPGKGVSKPATRTGKLGQSCANNLFCCGSRWRNVIEVLLR